MATETASALPLNNGNQMAINSATNFLMERDMCAAWQNSAILSNVKCDQSDLMRPTKFAYIRSRLIPEINEPVQHQMSAPAALFKKKSEAGHDASMPLMLPRITAVECTDAWTTCRQQRMKISWLNHV